MSIFNKDVDVVFHCAGAKVGLEIWCIENLQLVPVPKSLYGRFCSGSAYIILNTVLLKSGARHDIHYWLGSDGNEVDSALASDKALELDAALGSCAVQYREVQGQETEKFLSYFKPCIIPIDGVYSSPPEHLNGETYQVSLLSCKGDHVVHVKEVPFSRSSLNHNDVFILDTVLKIFLFSGCNSSIQERAKALEVVQYIKETKHNGNCEVATIEDGKFVGDPDVGEFWSLFGGYAPIPRDSPSVVHNQPYTPPVKLFWITTQGKLCESETNILSRDMLDSDKCYMLDCDAQIFVWMGRTTSLTERKTSISSVEDFLRNQGRSSGTQLTFLTEGLETAVFRSCFDNWPQTTELKLYEEGRGKVAALFKQHGYDVKEIPEEDCQPFIDLGGKLKVWRVNGDELFLLPVPEQTKLFSADCHIVQYTYPGNERDETLFYLWFGRRSLMEDRVDAIFHLNAIVDSTRGNVVLAQVTENKEPDLFFWIFQTLIVFQGGTSKRYKNCLAEKGIPDGTYDKTKAALFRVQGSSLTSMQAIQVDPVSSSLNASYCFILQTEALTFTWIGNLSLAKDYDILDRMLELINPTCQPLSVREGSEPDIFWNALGVKTEYKREKEIKAHTEDPHLFKLKFTDGDFKVKEIYNFTQDDLTTEDVLVLDFHMEIHVWIGSHSTVGAKKEALTLGLKFLEIDILGEGLSLETPIYVVTEGQEPPFFTRFFVWDSTKANMHGNSFERKIAILKGRPSVDSNSYPRRASLDVRAPIRSPSKLYSTETTPEGSRSNPLSSNGPVKSLSPTSNVSSFNETPVTRKLFSESSPHPDNYENADSIQVDGSADAIKLVIIPYEQLKVGSTDPAADIDVTKREAYLSEEEFEEKFKMTKKAFYGLPTWRRNKLKMSLHLF